MNDYTNVTDLGDVHAFDPDKVVCDPAPPMSCAFHEPGSCGWTSAAGCPVEAALHAELRSAMPETRVTRPFCLSSNTQFQEGGKKGGPALGGAKRAGR